MISIVKILIAIGVFGLIILVHEFGHFIVARAVGVKVIEFSMGMGPRLFTVHGKKTDFSLKLLPFGGSCALKGEMQDESGDDDCFVNKKPWQRFCVLFAGPFANLVLAFIAAVILVANLGTDPAYINSVMDGYPAQEAGLKGGDTVLSIDGRNVYLYREIRLHNELHAGETADFRILRNDEVFDCRVEPRFDAKEGRYLFGIQSDGVNIMPENFIDTLKYSYYEIRLNILTTFDSLAFIIRGKAKKDDIMGPVGMVNSISETVEETYRYGIEVVILTILDYLLLFSANIGIINLLPFPALDGGRILFVLIEWITGKPVSRKIENFVHVTGFMLLMLLMVFIMYNDIVKIVF